MNAYEQVVRDLNNGLEPALTMRVIKPRLKLGADGKIHILRMPSDVNRGLVIATIKFIRKRPGQADFAKGLQMYCSSSRYSVQQYAAICACDREPWHRFGLPWRVVELEEVYPMRWVTPEPLKARRFTLELL